jgi:hypothetical protein
LNQSEIVVEVKIAVDVEGIAMMIDDGDRFCV